MRSTLYTNIVWTVIAICMVALTIVAYYPGLKHVRPHVMYY